MNNGQIENCVDFIAACIKQHGKKDPIESKVVELATYSPCWVVKLDGREISLREYKSGQRHIHISDNYLTVYDADGKWEVLGTGKDKIENEKRLIETLMLFNGDLSHKEYANGA